MYSATGGENSKDVVVVEEGVESNRKPRRKTQMDREKRGGDNWRDPEVKEEQGRG